MDKTSENSASPSHEDEETTTLSSPAKAIGKNDMWPEVRRAFETKRYELTLIGPEISKRIEDADGRLDSNIFKLKHMNFLEIAKTKLSVLPAEIGSVHNMTSLLCHTNSLTSVPAELGLLVNLKNLDLSNNKLTKLPEELRNLSELMSINLSGNQLDALFPLEKLSKLAVLDVSRNKFKKLPDDLGSSNLENLSQVNASFNELVEISENLVELSSLKLLNLENNQITHCPAVLCQCIKLKDLLLKENKLKDNRLKKLVEQDKGKAIIEYLERIYVEESKNKPKAATASSGGKGKKTKSETFQIEYDLIKILHSQNEAHPSREVVVNESIGELRPHIVCAILRLVNLEAPGNFKKFLTIQTKLHDEICQKRTLATIATHDLESIKSNLIYDAADPEDIEFVPLGRKNFVTAKEYYEKLVEEAEAERKAKKRNQLSGVYKYLTLLEGQDKFAYLKDSDGVVSLPPLTNSEKTKISANSKNILVEITSSSSSEICKKVMEDLILEMIRAGITSSSEVDDKLEALSINSDATSTQETSKAKEANEPALDGKLRHTLLMQQVRVVDAKGALKTVYPSRVDLTFSGSSTIKVARLYND